MLGFIKRCLGTKEKDIEPVNVPAAAAEPAAAEQAFEPVPQEHLAEDRAVIQTSLLFQPEWYRRTYGFGEYLDAAEHYLTLGWKQGLDPSELFSTKGYLARYPDAAAAGVNPLLHFEREGYAKGYYRDEIEAERDQILAENPGCQEDITGGLLRIRITNACNAKCRYCGVRLGFGPEKEHAMEPKWYYEYCRPLYEKVNTVLITGGDAFIAQESYPYMQFLTDEYPALTVMTESNGIAFDERFRQLAARGLFKTHFSINASTADIFAASCWEGTGGETVYPRMLENIRAYVELLQQQDKLCFAPSLSMVINHDNHDDVMDFMKLALRLHSWYICFFFDYTENDMTSDYFGRPEQSRKVLRMLMEIERVLAGRVLVYFRLWLPGKETEPLQRAVEAMPLAELQAKYADLLELSEGRSMEQELAARNAWRRRQGKKELQLNEDFLPSIQLKPRQGREMCFAPWQEIDLYPNGRLDFCGWFDPTLNLLDFVQDERVDWERVLNSFPYMSARKRILQDDFRGCQLCCPMNSCKNPIVSINEYGADRLKK